MSQKELPENILDKALLLHDQGTSVSDILEMFPEYKTELDEIFETVVLLEKTAKGIEPSLKLSGSIVTKLDNERSIKGSSFVFPWKIILPAGAMAALLLVVMLGQFQEGTLAPESQDLAVEESTSLAKDAGETTRATGGGLPPTEALPQVSFAQIELTVAEINQEESEIDFAQMDDFFMEEFNTAEIDSALAEF